MPQLVQVRAFTTPVTPPMQADRSSRPAERDVLALNPNGTVVRAPGFLPQPDRIRDRRGGATLRS